MLPAACKHLLIINVIIFLFCGVLKLRGIYIEDLFGLHYFQSSKFHFYQLITYAFLHGSFSHLFFNMFAIWMFGAALENMWGSKRFLIYCFAAALGAALMQEITYWFMYHDIAEGVYSGVKVMRNGISAVVPPEAFLGQINTVGASGICFGLLLAFGIMFPNNYIYLYFLLPIKVKYFVAGYMILELLNGIAATNDGVAHFAHLGGALAGLLLFVYWKKKNRNDYEIY
ncbi:MAG: rhomboid family intramembrane serine protease [Bacteroidales bacterium]|nr:rhomboid family intramembrane serine protease [Bacteroidales bacterium]